MPRKADLSHLPVIEDGVTMSDLAETASLALGRSVTCEDVYWIVVKRGAATVGRRRIVVTRPREEERQVVARSDVPQVLAALAEALDGRS